MVFTLNILIPYPLTVLVLIIMRFPFPPYKTIAVCSLICFCTLLAYIDFVLMPYMSQSTIFQSCQDRRPSWVEPILSSGYSCSSESDWCESCYVHPLYIYFSPLVFVMLFVMSRHTNCLVYLYIYWCSSLDHKIGLKLPLVSPISDYIFHQIRSQVLTNQWLPFLSNQQTGELIISQSDICLME